MRKVLLAAMVCVMAIGIGCQPSLPEKCDGGAKDKSAKCDHDHDAKCDHDHDKAKAKDASTISPELKEKAITRIKEIQGT